MRPERFEAGQACFTGLVIALRSRKSGWSLVDQEMQRQIEAGVCSPEDYAVHFEKMGYLESWNAYQRFREENLGVDVPPEINAITSSLPSAKPETHTPVDPTSLPIERWGNDDRWREFLQLLPEPENDFGRLYVQLVHWKSKEPAFLLRSHGLSARSHISLRKILERIQREPEIGRQAVKGDDQVIHSLLANP